ncbi:hypothetical protein [Pseudoduganella namucuonensis]|uniref:Uncharacterized protein n=1 Tax=Pseudoduganella namucuonensis TaxID=1035707 RepID=A0A1I7L691_9BURK|nr:hypothetical protein [Pseudoduganella namucuonensis]SFV05158.1 hypothetical protein SAMN05216552_1023107 [Pseudoduganella namucuonensis]
MRHARPVPPMRGHRLALAAALAASLLAQPCLAQNQAAPLGRLFNTPQDRALLDARRLQGGAPVEPAPPPVAAPAEQPPPPPPPMQLNGVLLRSNGKSTVWVNQSPLPEGSGTVAKDRSVTLRLPSGQRVTLKPGQSYDESTGVIQNEGQ